MKTFSVAVLCSIRLVIFSAQAVYLVPDWEDEAQSRDVFTFRTNENPAFAVEELSLNPFGEAEIDIVIGAFGEGWLSSDIMTRDGETGVWDMGRGTEEDGIMNVRVPVASENTAYRIYVEAMGYTGPVGLPTLHLSSGGDPVDTAFDDVLNQSDPPGAWYHRVWETDVTSNDGMELAFLLRGTNEGSTIDRLAIYVIPEPNALLFGFLCLGIIYWRRRERITYQ